MYVRFSAAEQAEIWDRYEAGEYMRPIARAVGRSQWAVRDLIAKTGGVRPLVPTEWSDARLSLDEMSRWATPRTRQRSTMRSSATTRFGLKPTP